MPPVAALVAAGPGEPAPAAGLPVVLPDGAQLAAVAAPAPHLADRHDPLGVVSGVAKASRTLGEARRNRLGVSRLMTPHEAGGGCLI